MVEYLLDTYDKPKGRRTDAEKDAIVAVAEQHGYDAAASRFGLTFTNVANIVARRRRELGIAAKR
jgi:hypothetical protein